MTPFRQMRKYNILLFVFVLVQVLIVEGVPRYRGEEGPYFEGDIVNGPMTNNGTDMLQSDGVINRRYRWTQNTLVYQYARNFPTASRVTFERAMRHISESTCILFRQRRNRETNYIRVFQDNGLCYSHVGMIGGRNLLSLGDGCDFGTHVHELIHAIGFYHVQSRPDRDSHVIVHTKNIDPDYAGNFDKKSSLDVSTFDVEYDFSSIMHYGRKYFSINGNDTITPVRSLKPGEELGQRNGMSSTDKQKIQNMYCAPNISSTEAPNISSTVAPNISSTVAPNISSTVAPNISSTVAPNISSTVAPNISSTVAPNISSTVAPNISSTVAPNISSTVAPNISSKVAPIRSSGNATFGALIDTINKSHRNGNGHTKRGVMCLHAEDGSIIGSVLTHPWQAANNQKWSVHFADTRTTEATLRTYIRKEGPMGFLREDISNHKVNVLGYGNQDADIWLFVNLRKISNPATEVGTYRIVNKRSKQCLVYGRMNQINWTYPVITTPCNPDAQAQLWRMIPLDQLRGR